MRKTITKKGVLLVAVLLLTLVMSSFGFASKQKPVIGVALASVQSPAFQVLADTLEKTAKELGASATILTAEHNLERQMDQVQDLITKKVDAIIINSVDANGIVPVVKLANRRGIPVLAIDRKILGGEIAYAIETDNVAAGRAAAQYFALTTANEGKKIEVLEIIADPTATALRERQEGFEWEVKNWAHMEIVAQPSIGTSTEKAYNAVIDSFRVNPNIKAIFTSCDLWTPPILSALKSIGKLYPVGHPDHVMVASVDGDSICLEALRKGENDVVIAQIFDEMARKAMAAAVELAKGNELPSQMELLPTLTVNKDNLDYLGSRLWGYTR